MHHSASCAIQGYFAILPKHLSEILETSHSGLVHSLGKRAGCQSPREFESLRLRRRPNRTRTRSFRLSRRETERFESRSGCAQSTAHREAGSRKFSSGDEKIIRDRISPIPRDRDRSSAPSASETGTAPVRSESLLLRKIMSSRIYFARGEEVPCGTSVRDSKSGVMFCQQAKRTS